MTDIFLGYLREFGAFDTLMAAIWLFARVMGRIADFDKAIALRARLKRTLSSADSPASAELKILLAQLDELEGAYTLSKATGVKLRQIAQSHRAYTARLSAALPSTFHEIVERPFVVTS
ncbi:conserved hypothetical protein [Paraburkholderia tropica]|uniref:hypothetical protein n=1 Tax=Paraburkholderia tropica TaxID=92647 RepID=UPI001CAF3CD6|nr:hypothetical protein [Paraburkholderia tropica]CAG9189158.1 conserved hypothetical protein [Paraburkholderia tropica]